MSMTVLTILQFSATLFWYLVLTTGIPALIFSRKVSGFSMSVRFFFYLLVGNFSLMNLVFALQLLHISNRVTLTLGTFVMYMVMDHLNNRRDWRSPLNASVRVLELYFDGQMKTRTFFLRIFRFIRKQTRRGFRFIDARIKGRETEWIAFAAVSALILWQYGWNLITNYAYCASDIVVHNYWINSMSQGEIFVAGVYPFGFHCIIYYLHAVIGLDTYVLLRVFYLVQTFLVYFSLMTFLKICCKNRYIPYIGVLIYAGPGILADATRWRFCASLPQEFGMVFILPSIFFLYLFFQKKEQELRLSAEETDSNAAAKPKDSFLCLVAFGIAFSMTISAHFYNTMIAGIFCVAIAVGYAFRLFRKQYFGRIMVTGILSVFLAILPMGIALAMGTSLEGSLQWGMEIISTGSEEEESVTETESEEATEAESSASLENSRSDATKTTSSGMAVGAGSILSALWERAAGVVEVIQAEIKYYVLKVDYDECSIAFLILMAAVPVLGALLLLSRRWREYGARMLSTGLCLDMLGVLLSAEELGLPALMDGSRCSIFFAFLSVAALTLLLDVLWHFLTAWIRNGRVKNAALLLCVVLASAVTLQSGLVDRVEAQAVYGTNGAVTCLTNIIRDNKDFTWTICSANDELRMGEDHGYHYEISDFLYAMEGSGELANIIIPTQYVYFFIEKVPIDYYIYGYGNSGQSISEEGAERLLPYGSSSVIYQLENRWIMMSRMYYWAQAFMELYPNEFQVYYETDEFVCYYIEQNTYYLYNFAIDYGYNNVLT
ncbi:MAG: hypothetical protein LIO99_07825 [Clostridiales bacterium]|nr:hypothetical protein [Clostridiales bacterium]